MRFATFYSASLGNRVINIAAWDSGSIIGRRVNLQIVSASVDGTGHVVAQFKDCIGTLTIDMPNTGSVSTTNYAVAYT